MGTITITSISNPRIREMINLRKKRERDRSQFFLIEGYREILMAMDAKWKIRSLYICPELFLKGNEKILIERSHQNRTEIISCTKRVFEKISYRDRPDGLLAIGEQQHRGREELSLTLSSNPFLFIAESIEKPGNLGTMLRSCDGAGVDGAILCDACTDLFNPNVVRASIGTLFTLPLFELTSEEAISFLKERNITIVATSPDAKMEFTEADFSRPIAIVVGTEQYGLSERWKNHCDMEVSIPMLGNADSLNVATATSLLLYEANRQRRRVSSPL